MADEILKRKIAMAGYDNSSDANIPNDSDACYEKIASQEEFYLEENEEEIRDTLVTDDPSPTQESLKEQLTEAAEALITGDPDDPPLSDEAIEGMLNPN